MGGGGIGGVVGGVVGGVIGSVVPGVGTAVGASIGGGIGGAAGSAMDGGGPFQILTSGALGAFGGYYGGELVGGYLTGGSVAATGMEAGAQGAAGLTDAGFEAGNLAGEAAVNTSGFATSQAAGATEYANLAQAYVNSGLAVPEDVLLQAGSAFGGYGSSDLAAHFALGTGEFGSQSAGQLANIYNSAYQAAPYAGTYGFNPATANLASEYAYGNIIPGTEGIVQAGSQAGVESAVSAMNNSTNLMGKVSDVATGVFSENTPGITHASYNHALDSGMDLAKVAAGVKHGTLATGPADTMVPNQIGTALNVGKTGYSMATAPVPQDFDQSKEYANPWGGKGYANPSGRSLALDRKQYPDNRQIQGYGLNMNMFAKK